MELPPGNHRHHLDQPINSGRSRLIFFPLLSDESRTERRKKDEADWSPTARAILTAQPRAIIFHPPTHRLPCNRLPANRGPFPSEHRFLMVLPSLLISPLYGGGWSTIATCDGCMAPSGGRRRRWRDAVFEVPVRPSSRTEQVCGAKHDGVMRFHHPGARVDHPPRAPTPLRVSPFTLPSFPTLLWRGS